MGGMLLQIIIPLVTTLAGAYLQKKGWLSKVPGLGGSGGTVPDGLAVGPLRDRPVLSALLKLLGGFAQKQESKVSEQEAKRVLRELLADLDGDGKPG